MRKIVFCTIITFSFFLLVGLSNENKQLKTLVIVDLRADKKNHDKLLDQYIKIEFDTMFNTKRIERFTRDSNVITNYYLLEKKDSDTGFENFFKKNVFSVEKITFDTTICVFNHFPNNLLKKYLIEIEQVKEFFAPLDSNLPNYYLKTIEYNKAGLIDSYEYLDLKNLDTFGLCYKKIMFYYKYY